MRINGRYCIKNIKTGKFFAAFGANERMFPWVDSIEDAHRNASDIWYVRDWVDHILMCPILQDGTRMDVKREDLVIVDTVENVEITETKNPKLTGGFIFG